MLSMKALNAWSLIHNIMLTELWGPKEDEACVEDYLCGLAVVVQIGGLAGSCVPQSVKGRGALIWYARVVEGASLCREGVHCALR
jgi:hypothetical protein